MGPQQQRDGQREETEDESEGASDLAGAAKGKHEQRAYKGHKSEDGEPRESVHRVAPHSRKPASAMSAMPIMRR